MSNQVVYRIYSIPCPFEANASFTIKINDKKGTYDIVVGAAHGISKNELQLEEIVPEIVNFYYVRKNGISMEEFDEGARLLKEKIFSEYLNYIAVKSGNLTIIASKEVRFSWSIKILEMNRFCDSKGVTVYNLTQDEVDEGLEKLRNHIFDEANVRKICMKNVIEIAEKLSSSIGFHLQTEQMNPFERIEFFDTKAGSDDPVVMDKFTVPFKASEAEEEKPFDSSEEKPKKKMTLLEKIKFGLFGLVIS